MGSDVSIERMPGGVSVAAGGTRTAIKLDRPWQPDIVITPETCPFCRQADMERREFRRIEKGGGWRVINNAFTPFPFHRLIIPFSCWPKEELRRLGGVEQIRRVLDIFSEMYAAEKRDELWLTVHIGALAGQNVMHLHFHVQQILGQRAVINGTEDYIRAACPELEVFSDMGLRVVATGHRAGQCLIARAHDAFLKDWENSFAVVLDRLIGLYATKFRSRQGLPPDFMLFFGLSSRGPLYASYVPILNQMGGPEYLGLLEGTPMIIPWPHAATAAHLRAG
ncbi:MAG TPA: hypothetical protein VFQ60_04910 [Patescibacteria group bacterium]|nr:hypothetical protein [Patescibacteria group bacterium]